ncbi:MAG: hypothetical protein COA58_16710 [Bacteroidetes bacterium]|nr:MAG: hypothetical protein COA58_16710 [Bacteroidota bacterium]
MSKNRKVKSHTKSWPTSKIVLFWFGTFLSFGSFGYFKEGEVGTAVIVAIVGIAIIGGALNIRNDDNIKF